MKTNAAQTFAREVETARRSRRVPLKNACGICHYCDCPVYPAGSPEALADPLSTASNDHHTPFSITSGSDLKESGQVTACRRCNDLKADTPPELFEYFVSQTDMRQSLAMLRKEYRRFCYLLLVCGFKTAKALAHVRGKPIELPHFLRRPVATPTPAKPPRLSKRDLRVLGRRG